MPLVELQTVDSTNNYALSLIKAGSVADRPLRQTEKREMAEHGLCIFAHEQVAGKGQRGRNWTSAKGQNIAVSIIVDPSGLDLTRQFELSICAAVAVCRFFKKYAGDDTRIKWPNDLYWQNRKAGGILIESSVRPNQSGAASWEWAIIGIGVNINQTRFPGELPNAVSLKQITGKDFEPLRLATELCESFGACFDELMIKGISSIMPFYLSHLYRLNEQVRLQKGNRVFSAVIKDVRTNGKLVVQHAIQEEFDHGEVQWLPD